MGKHYSVTPEVLAMGQIHLTGNITPPIWFERLKNSSGKPNAVAVTILSEIVYWYRPKQIYDEATGKLKGVRSRFKDKKLQRSYQSFSDKFGFTKRQVQDACYFLRDKGLITLEPTTVTLPDGSKIGNVLFIGIKPEAIQALTWVGLPEEEEDTPHTLERISYPQEDPPYTPERTSSSDETDKLELSDVGASSIKRIYTEITPETPTEITPETTLPPTPQGEKDEGGEDEEMQAIEAEVEVVPVQSFEQAKEDNGFSEQSSFSEIPSLPQACDNREIGEQKYKRNEARYPKNIDGSDRLPWHTRERKKFDPEFEAHMARSLARTSFYKNLPAGELLTKVRQHIWKGNFEVDRRGALELEWDAMNEAKKAPQATEMTVDQLVKRVEVQAACRGMEPSARQQAPSPRINPQLKKEKLRLTTQLKRARNALASKLETPFPEMYPPALIAQLQAAVEQAQRELTAFEAEMEFGF